ncbi:MAG: ATP-binding protein [Pirellula sp.]|jgi:NAD-dependent dihydropyrimidine dehydrogenase PreA subunit
MIRENHGLLVVVSQGQSRSPEKRELEEGIANLAVSLPKTFSLVVPHLYDLSQDSESLKRMREWKGPIVLLTWLFDRAAFWVLDRMEVRGQFGAIELKNPDTLLDSDEDEDEGANDEDDKAEDRVANIHARPDRNIYSIDMRSSSSIGDFEREFRRILEAEDFLRDAERTTLSLDRFLNPTNTTALSASVAGTLEQPMVHDAPLGIVPMRIEEHPTRRWYPVIDYSRCTNCMECIDFCLFGVYGVDKAETILVEQPDNCRKGCPACSRVCPENAIIFPQHKTPAIAGAPVEAGSAFKIDLSKLFGAPERNEDPAAAAARERDEQLILAGRAAVGMATVGANEASTSSGNGKGTNDANGERSKDELDNLIDQLDDLNL